MSMSTSNVQPMIEPSSDDMRAHVAHLFEGWLDGCHEGKVELAWTDGHDGKLRHAAIFATDQLDELVERAVLENRKPGQNVYVGQALRKPDIPPFGRLLEEVRQFGARFVVLDTAADLFGGNENIRSQVRQFIANACGRIAREIDGAVLLCAHPSLSGMASGSGSSGSTAWNNTVRSRLYLTHATPEPDEEPDPDLRMLTRKKANYARAGESMMLRWSDGIMVPVAPDTETTDDELKARVLDEIDRAWRDGQPYSDMPQARTRYVLAHLPKRIGTPRSAVEHAYLALSGSGHIRVELHDSHTTMRGLRAVQPTQISTGGET